MRLASLLGPDLRQTLAQEPEALREALEEFHEEDIAEIEYRFEMLKPYLKPGKPTFAAS